MVMITKAQIKKIWALAREMQLDEDLLRAVVEDVSGSESISKLSKQQAIWIIDRLKKTGRAGMATQKQIWKMKQLAIQLGWAHEKRLTGFVKKYAQVERLEWITAAQAWRIIEGLKKVLVRQDTSEQGGMINE